MDEYKDVLASGKGKLLNISGGSDFLTGD